MFQSVRILESTIDFRTLWTTVLNPFHQSVRFHPQRLNTKCSNVDPRFCDTKSSCFASHKFRLYDYGNFRAHDCERLEIGIIASHLQRLIIFVSPHHGPANVYCDNQGVVKNTSLPESTLAKKHNAINYHTVREAVAARIMRVAKEPTETNLADLFTKALSQRRREFLLAHMVYGRWTLESWITGRKRKREEDPPEEEQEHQS